MTVITNILKVWISRELCTRSDQEQLKLDRVKFYWYLSIFTACLHKYIYLS